MTVDVTDAAVSPDPIERVRWPVMFQRWDDITFLHWRYEPSVIEPLLPRSLELEAFDGSAWVSVTPFRLRDVRPTALPPLPWLSESPETNVRTYVRDADGRSGIWFFSLDIARLPLATLGRITYRIPYMWARLEIQQSGDHFRYRGRRRIPPHRASYDITVERHGPVQGSMLDHFLTARWAMFSTYGRFLSRTAVEHAPWPLWRASVVDLHESLITSLGVPSPEGVPLVHFSPGVLTRISAPHFD